MRKGRFTDELMVAILREADRGPVATVAKKHGVNEQMISSWRKRFGAMQADDIKRLKQFEAGNARLKKLRRRMRQCWRGWRSCPRNIRAMATGALQSSLPVMGTG